MARELFHIALSQIRLRRFAATGAGPAVDLLLDFLSHTAKAALGKVVNFHMPPELLVLFELFFSEAFYLDEIRYH